MPGGSLQPHDRLADRIRLHRQADARPVVVGEGEADRRFIDRVLSAGTVAFFIAGTRDIVLETGRDVAALGMDHIACVVDRDFDDVVAAAEAEGLPVVAYDNADLESMLWGSPILDDVVDEIGSAQKLHALGGVTAVRQAATDAVRPLQRLRRANAVHGWGLPFDTLDLRRKVSMTSLTMGNQSLCDALWSGDLGIAKGQLYEAAASYPEATCPVTGLPLVRGRDALAALGVVLRRAAGNLSFQDAHPNRLSEMVRLRATEAALASTRWLVRLGELLNL
jgi:hypothetical protein